jgi:hypothetical protein
MTNENYIERLKQAIFHLHKSGSFHLTSVPVKEVFHGRTLWEGDVEMFDLLDHPKAKRCYGWTYGDPEEFIVILELPPVTDAQSAVKAGIAHQIKKAGGKK